MTVLVWPRQNDEPLPRSSGVVLGWSLDNVVICARVLDQPDEVIVKRLLDAKTESNSTLTSLQVLGTWGHSDHGSWPSLHGLPVFAPDPSDPWWASTKKDEDDLLIYFEPQGTNFDISFENELQIGFAPLLKHLSRIDSDIYALNIWDYPKRPDSNDRDENVCSRNSTLVQLDPVLRNSLLFHHFRRQIAPMRLIHATTSSNSEGSAILDCFLGILLAALILFHKESLRQTIGSTVIDIKQYLRTAILWLETFPVGFKLNVPLTQSMGRQILFVLDLWHEHVLQTILVGWRLEVLLQLLSLTSLCMGSTTLLAVTVDFLQLSTLHLTAIYIFFAYIYRCQLHMLDSLWKLFQGKKRNPLRRRTDTMHYDSMQLLVGMLTFSFVLFLFTTVLVYFLFFACAYIALQPVVLWFLYGLLRDLPIGNLWNRWRHPKLTGVGIYLEMQSPTTAWLRIIPRSYPSVLADFVRRYPHRLFSLVGKILLFLGSGKRLEIMADCIKPK